MAPLIVTHSDFLSVLSAFTRPAVLDPHRAAFPNDAFMPEQSSMEGHEIGTKVTVQRAKSTARGGNHE